MNTRILFVDDDPNILSAHQRNFRKKFQVDVALGAQEAITMLGNPDPYAVIVADMQMPKMSGIEFLLKARELAPDTVRMMLTGNIDQGTAAEAINRGNVYRFMNKPCPPEILEISIENGLKQYHLITAERQLLEKTLAGSIKILTDILAVIDPQSFGVSQKLREYVRLFVASRHIPDSWSLEVAALLSQIGFATVPAQVAQKAHKGVPLSGPEKDMLARATGIAQSLIQNIPRLETVAQIVGYQDKNFDGSGYPVEPLSGVAIPYGSRLFKIFLEVIRQEERGASRLEAFLHIQKNPDHFDPDLSKELLEFLSLNVNSVLTAVVSKTKREIKLSELAVGQKLIGNIMTPDGLVVVSASNVITPLLLERIRNFAEVQRLVEPFVVEG